MLQAGTVLFLLNMTASSLNYLCQFLMARVLSVELYGTINTIFSFMMIIAVPGTTLTMITAKYYASVGSASHKRGYLKKQLLSVSVLTIGVFALLTLGQNFLSKILSIQDRRVLFSTFILAASGYFQPFYSGVFSGNKRFMLTGIYSTLIPLYKLIAVGVAYICAADATARLYVILAGMIVGVVFTAFFGQIKANGILDKSKEKGNVIGRLYTPEDVHALFMNISLMLYMNADLLSVRYFGDDFESGLYSSVLLFGRIIYYFSTTLGTILLPSVAGCELSEREQRGMLNRTLLIMGVFSLVCIVPVNIWKDSLIKCLFGASYLPASKYVIYVSMISLAISIDTILINYVVGIGKTKPAMSVMIIMDLALGAIILIFHNIVTVLLTIGVVGMTGAIAIYWLNYKKYGKDQVIKREIWRNREKL